MPAVAHLVLGLAVAWAAAGGGCRHDTLGQTPLSASPVVATVEGVPVHARDVATQMHRTGGDARRALDQLITFEALAAAAAAAGTTVNDPAQLDALRSLRVQRLIERELEPHLRPDAIAEPEVLALYERAKGRFVHGRLVQAAVLCVFTGARMKPAPRARAENNARELRALLATHASHDAAEFEAISKDRAWVDRKVSLTTVWQGDEQPFPPVVGRAVQSLSRPGAITDLVGDETGYYIALYLAEQPPLNVSFAEAAPALRQEMFEPWRRQRFMQMSLAMAQGHDIEVFPENFPLLNERQPP